MTQELKPFKLGSVELGEYCLAYDAYDVDIVLAEKDAEIRRLKRALWLTRVNRAKSMSCIDMYSKYKDKHPFTINQSFDEWVLIWQAVERKCRAKAEQYK